MANFKIVISDPKTRKSWQKEVEQPASGLIGKKVGDKVSGDSLGLSGFELEVTGGSDAQGFPMRRDVEGQGRKRIILTSPPGFHPVRKGQRRRKGVRGNTVTAEIVQVNTKVVKEGAKKIEELLGKKEEKPKEEKKAEKSPEKKEEKQEKKEHKPEEKKAEAKPKEEKAAEKAEAKMGVKKLE